MEAGAAPHPQAQDVSPRMVRVVFFVFNQKMSTRVGQAIPTSRRLAPVMLAVAKCAFAGTSGAVQAK
jgi:hypothetical protein